jgi:phage shock protein A
MTITHEQICAEVIALKTNFANHASAAAESRTELRSDVHAIRDKLDALGRQWSGLENRLANLENYQRHASEVMKDHQTRIAVVEVAGARRAERDGLIGGVLKSPFVAWIAAALLAGWAFVVKAGGDGQ